jgi:hypothetical protein
LAHRLQVRSRPNSAAFAARRCTQNREEVGDVKYQADAVGGWRT